MGDWASGIMLPDIPRVLTALAEWLACLTFLLGLKERMRGWRFALTSGLMLALMTIFLVVTDDAEGILWLICMAVAIFLMFLYLIFCANLPSVTMGYHCVEAFLLAEFTASLHWQLYCFFSYGMEFAARWVLTLSVIVIYGGVNLVMYVFSLKFLGERGSLEITKRELVMACIIGLSVFLISNVGFVYSNTPFSSQYSTDIFNVRTLIDLGGMAIIFAYHSQLLNLHMQNDLMVMEAMLQSQYQQYQTSKETQELINYKYHDLKNYVLTMRAGGEDYVPDPSVLNRIESEISDYETQNKTGHPVLDTLLSAKSIACKANQIDLTAVVDGTILDFMDTIDICSIFGNALDNAIECEKKIPEEEKRLISLAVFSQNNAFIVIRCENYCQEEVNLSEKIPRSTKGDPSLHGYGLKSMRHTVHKYGGEMLIELDENWFRLKILIPRKQYSAS